MTLPALKGRCNHRGVAPLVSLVLTYDSGAAGCRFSYLTCPLGALRARNCKNESYACRPLLARKTARIALSTLQIRLPIMLCSHNMCRSNRSCQKRPPRKNRIFSLDKKTGFLVDIDEYPQSGKTGVQ